MILFIHSVFTDASGVFEDLSVEERKEWETLSVTYNPQMMNSKHGLNITGDESVLHPLVHCHPVTYKPVSYMKMYTPRKKIVE